MIPWMPADRATSTIASIASFSKIRRDLEEQRNLGAQTRPCFGQKASEGCPGCLESSLNPGVLGELALMAT